MKTYEITIKIDINVEDDSKHIQDVVEDLKISSYDNNDNVISFLPIDSKLINS